MKITAHLQHTEPADLVQGAINAILSSEAAAYLVVLEPDGLDLRASIGGEFPDYNRARGFARILRKIADAAESKVDEEEAAAAADPTLDPDEGADCG